MNNFLELSFQSHDGILRMFTMPNFTLKRELSMALLCHAMIWSAGLSGVVIMVASGGGRGGGGCTPATPQDECTPLLIAAQDGKSETVHALIDSKANIEATVSRRVAALTLPVGSRKGSQPKTLPRLIGCLLGLLETNGTKGYFENY
jgi:hypothetical protein